MTNKNIWELIFQLHYNYETIRFSLGINSSSVMDGYITEDTRKPSLLQSSAKQNLAKAFEVESLRSGQTFVRPWGTLDGVINSC